MKIGLLGDTHGNTAWTRFAVAAFGALGIDRVVQVGDFGFYTGRDGSKFLSGVSEQAMKHGVHLWVVPGNHENWDYVNSLTSGADSWVLARQNIYVAPRVHRWEWEGVSFASLSGAPSVDRSWREESNKKLPGYYVGDKNWYAEEVYTLQNVFDLVQGGPADVMIAHDAPEGVQKISEQIGGNPHALKARDLEYAAAARKLMTQAVHAVRPKVFAHGHYHFPVDEQLEDTRVFGLNRDTFEKSLGILDLETLVPEFVDHRELLTAFRKGKL